MKHSRPPGHASPQRQQSQQCNHGSIVISGCHSATRFTCRIWSRCASFAGRRERLLSKRAGESGSGGGVAYMEMNGFGGTSTLVPHLAPEQLARLFWMPAGHSRADHAPAPPLSYFIFRKFASRARRDGLAGGDFRGATCVNMWYPSHTYDYHK